MLSSKEFVSLRVAITRSSGRNCTLAAPGGSRNQYKFICPGRDCLLVCTCNFVARLVHFGAVSCVHCTSFAFLFLVDIVGISRVSFVL